MEEYVLTDEGKQKFGWIRDNMATDSEGYLVLSYLFENGTATADAIAAYARLPRDKAAYLLEAMVVEGLVVESR